MALLAKEVPERHRKTIVLQIKADGFGPPHEGIVQLEIRRSGCRQPRQITFDIRQKYRNARSRKPFGHDLQRHSLAGPGRPSDQTMPVCFVQQQDLWCAVGITAAADKDVICHR